MESLTNEQLLAAVELAKKKGLVEAKVIQAPVVKPRAREDELVPNSPRKRAREQESQLFIAPAKQARKVGDTARSTIRDRDQVAELMRPQKPPGDVKKLLMGGTDRQHHSKHSSGALRPKNEVSSTNRQSGADVKPTAVKKKEMLDVSINDEYDGPKPLHNARREDMTIVESIQYGPQHFEEEDEHDAAKRAEGDKAWLKTEPNSGTRMSSRVLSHTDLSMLLLNRHVLRATDVYQLARPQTGKNTMEIPLVGEYIVMGTLAEKGEIRFVSRPRRGPASDDGRRKKKPKTKVEKAKGSDSEDEEEDEGSEKDDEEDEGDVKPRRYISFKLVDLHSPLTSSHGSSVLNLYLFESESSRFTDAKTGAQKDIYQAGLSKGGAYEKWWKAPEGSVVALVGPRVSKSFTMEGSNAGVLTLTIDGADDLIMIGKARDLGSCEATRRDGKPCNAWCDLRNTKVCEFHLKRTIGKIKAGRSELMSGTGNNYAGKSFNINGGKAAKFDPEKKTGLKPRQGVKAVDGVATYIVAGPGGVGARGTTVKQTGLTASGFRPTVRTGDKLVIGHREGPTVQGVKDERKAEASRKRAQELELKGLLRQESKGGRSVGGGYLVAAQAYRMKEKADLDALNGKKRKREEEPVPVSEAESAAKLRGFTTEAIRRIGFDPRTGIESAGAGAGATREREGADAKARRAEAMSFLTVGNNANTVKFESVPVTFATTAGGKKQQAKLKARADKAAEAKAAKASKPAKVAKAAKPKKPKRKRRVLSPEAYDGETEEEEEQHNGRDSDSDSSEAPTARSPRTRWTIEAPAPTAAVDSGGDDSDLEVFQEQ